MRVSGWHATANDARMFRYVARVHAWRGQPYVRVFYTFINDRQDALMAKIRKLELRFWNRAGRGRSACWTASRSRRAACSRSTRTSTSSTASRRAGAAAAGRAVGADEGGLAVGLREFWQNWPKAIECRAAAASALELCPELPTGLYDGKPLEEENKLYYALRGGVYTFKVGVAKTHEFWVTLLRRQAGRRAARRSSSRPPRSRCWPWPSRPTSARPRPWAISRRPIRREVRRLRRLARAARWTPT